MAQVHDNSLETASPEFGDDDDLEIDPDELKDKLIEIQTEIAKGEFRLNTRDDVTTFLDKKQYTNFAVHDTLGDGEGNLLHLLAGRNAPPALVKYLIQENPELMNGTNYAGHKPLYVAITSNNDKFISAILELYSSSTDGSLAKYLEEGQELTNCIHAAVKSKLTLDSTIGLIQKAHPRTLKAQDGGGLTPLHCAVDYNLCRKEQFDIVCALLKKNDAGLDIKSAKPDFLSVYQYHVWTKQKHERATSFRTKNQVPSERITPNIRENKILQNRGNEEHKKVTLKEQVQSVQNGQPILSSGTRDVNSTLGPDSTHLTPSRRASITVESKLTRRPTDLQPKGLQILNEPPNNLEGGQNGPRKGAAERMGAPRATAPGGRTYSSPRARARQRPQPKKVDKDTADKIAKELKTHYLRSIFQQHASQNGQGQRNHDTAVEFLYGRNEENRHICFTFLQGPSKMSAEKFKTTYGGFAFDPVLQYVAFRRVEFTTPQLPPRKKESSKSQQVVDRKGRRDMEIPFKWLYDTKGVRGIMKVIVHDLVSPSHSDESIYTALKQFEIEILDWRKVDLSPDTICNSCKGLREIHLWWSGNNGMLRAWSEPDGLAKLERLTKIHIHQMQNLESELWTHRKIEEFKERLRNVREIQNRDREDRLPDICVPTPVKALSISEEHRSKSGVETDPQVQFKTHKWLHTMDTFADGIESLREGIENLDDEDDDEFPANLPDGLKKDVRVALIDDGVQFGHESLEGKITDGWSFDDGYDGEDLPGARKPFHESQTGHGTLMANMICRVCPSAKIFSYRVKVISGHNSKSHFTPESAAEAVEYCAAREFDIISISWTVVDAVEEEHTSGAAKQQSATARIQKALASACDKGTLIFCAAPDEGSMYDGGFSKFYPVGCPQLSSQIFKIGAATANRVINSGVNKESQLDFILPGHEVTERGEETIEVEKNSLKTGSSIATALAAGLAALVIYCVRLAAIETRRRGTPNADAVKIESLDAVKTFRGMREIFLNIPKNPGETGKFLEVERTFDKVGKALDNKEISLDDKRNKLIGLARVFVDWARPE